MRREACLLSGWRERRENWKCWETDTRSAWEEGTDGLQSYLFVVPNDRRERRVDPDMSMRRYELLTDTREHTCHPPLPLLTFALRFLPPRRFESFG